MVDVRDILEWIQPYFFIIMKAHQEASPPLGDFKSSPSVLFLLCFVDLFRTCSPLILLFKRRNKIFAIFEWVKCDLSISLKTHEQGSPSLGYNESSPSLFPFPLLILFGILLVEQLSCKYLPAILVPEHDMMDSILDHLLGELSPSVLHNLTFLARAHLSQNHVSSVLEESTADQSLVVSKSYARHL